MKFEQSFNPSEQEIKQLRDILVKYNHQHFETDNHTEFALFAKEEDVIVGGVSGEIFGDWLEIDYLAIDEKYRHNKLGTKLLQDVENLAKEKNCRYIFLTTFGFQGKNYYPKFGFKEVFIKKNYPITGTEHYFIKELIY